MTEPVDRPALPVFEVLEPGLQTSVQDPGRPGLAHLGVPHGGAADPRSLAIANALLGNEPGAAGVECTLIGPTLRVLRTTAIAVTGADLDAHVVETGAQLEPGGSLIVRAGWTLSLSGPAELGARAYLAVAGGIAVPPVLGSRSTLLSAGLGGLDGRALRTGDVLSALPRAAHPPVPSRWTGPSTTDATTVGDPIRLRIAKGPDSAALGKAGSLALARTSWMVDPRSDRIGVRLAGPALPGGWSGERASIGVLPGAVQVPPDGRPIVLLVDAPPTGGYPVPAVVIRADLPIVGQLRPADEVHFEAVTNAEASAVLRDDDRAFELAVARLREAAGLDEPWRGPGA